MQTAVNSLAVITFLGTVVALFAISALLRMVRELQQSVLSLSAASSRPTSAVRKMAAFESDDGRPTFVLVVSPTCRSCAERSRHLATVAGLQKTGHLALLSDDARCAEWVAGREIRTLIDSEVLGQLAVDVFPTLVKYSPDGVEEWRRIAGSDQDLDALIELRGFAPATETR